MKKIKFLALLMLVGLVSVSCNDILDDNVNPDRAHAIEAKNGLPVSKLEGHGVGLASVSNIVERYGGSISINTDNNVFTVGIILYL